MNNIELLKEIIKDKTLEEINRIKLDKDYSNLSKYFNEEYHISIKNNLIIKTICEEFNATLVLRTITVDGLKSRYYVFVSNLDTQIEKFKEFISNTDITYINDIKMRYFDLSYFFLEHGFTLTHKQIIEIIREKYDVGIMRKRINGTRHNLFVDKNLVKQKPKSGASYHFEKWLIEHKEKYDIETLNAMKLNGSLSKQFSQIDDEFKDLGDIIITKTIKRIYNVKTIRRRIDGIRHYVFVENEEK